MERYDMKRKIAAALALAVLSGCMPFAALAEGDATPSEAQEQVIVPAGVEDEEQDGETPPSAEGKQKKKENVFTDATVGSKDASLDTASDGTISGSVEFSGAKMVVKLYKDGVKAKEATLNKSGSFTFTDLAPGSYTVRFYFWKEGDLPPKKEIPVTVGYRDVEKKDEGGTGGETGGSTGGETGGSTGGETGGSTGGETGGSTGGETGGSTGGETGGGTGGETGGSTGGETGGSTGSDTGEKGGKGPEATPVYTDASFASIKASSATAANGTISGSVTYTGEATVVVKLYSAANPNEKIEHKTIKTSGDSVTFTGLEPGDYRVDVHFYGEKTPETSKTVTVGYKEETPVTPDPAEKKVTDASFTSTKASSATAADGTIIGSVSYTGEATVVVKLYSAADPQTKIEHKTIKKSGDSVSFTGLAAGNYRLDVHFYEVKTPETSKTVTVGYEETPVTPDPAEKKFTEVNCSATKVSAEGAKDGKITGSVSYTGDNVIVVKLYAASNLGEKLDERKIRSSGESFSFDGLAAGAYKVDFHFFGEAASESRTVEVGTEKPAVAKIQITGVTGSENKLTVKGIAQPDAQILVSAEPATAKAEVLTVGSDGAFSASLVAEPGTYTRVTAYYVTDGSSAVSSTGSWKVTEPSKPTLTVDPVNINSTKVVAKTAAGVVVTLETRDSTQTLTADADGIVRFPLAHTYLNGDTFTLTVVYGPGSGQSFSQKVTVGGVSEYNELEYGDTGDDVLRLTTRLHELGYPVSPTTRFGSTVREAVRLFQIANGIKADGRAGYTMQSTLYSVSAIAYGSGKYPTLVRGDRGLALIYTLQQRLKDLGYYTIKVDGIFGSGTERAVRLFQKVNGLTETGKADNATQTLLYSSAAKPASSGVSGDYTTLSRSSKYRSAVVPLQRRLKSLGYYSGSIDGYFGSQTYRAVRNFQSRNGLSVTGVADPYTQEVLYSSSAKKASGSSSSGSSSSTGYRLLYWGCRGDAVKRLQNALISAGYKSIVRTADGIYGQWTYDAVKAYQKDHGLAVDGIAGKNTQNSLYGTNY